MYFGNKTTKMCELRLADIPTDSAPVPFRSGTFQPTDSAPVLLELCHHTLGEVLLDFVCYYKKYKVLMLHCMAFGRIWQHGNTPMVCDSDLPTIMGSVKT